MADFSAIRFQSGRPLVRELGAERLNAILAEIKRNKPKGERGITVRQSGDGTYIGLSASQGGKGSGASAHPFQVLTRKIEDAWHWGVVANSKTFDSISPTAAIIYPQNLLSENADDEDPGWLPIDTEARDYIYLEWDEENLSSKIDSVGSGGVFDPEASWYEEGGWLQTDFAPAIPVFEFARKIIATGEIVDGNPVVTQGIVQHQLLQDICYGGSPASWWFDYTGGNYIYE